MNREAIPRILIADDDIVHLTLLREILLSGLDDKPDPGKRHSYNIDMFENGALLLKAFLHDLRHGHRVPLCVLDMRMPLMNGLETAKALREADPNVVILFITFYEDISYDHLAGSLTRDVYLMSKPVRAREIRALVSSLLINWNHRRALLAAWRETEAANRRLETIIRHTPGAVAMFDLRMHYLACSEQWLAYFQLNRAEIIGRHHYDVLLDIPEHWKAEHRRCLSGEIIRHEEEVFFRADGTSHHVQRELHPMRDADGRISGLIIFIEFITEKRLAEKAREAAEERLREHDDFLTAVMSAIHASVMILDPESFTIVDANPHACELLGHAREDLIGRDFYDMKIHSGDRIVNDEYALTTKSGDVVHVRRSLRETSVHGRSYLVQSLLDITDIKQFTQKQELDIELAKTLLRMVNGVPSPRTPLSENRSLFFDALYMPCFKEGGDHFFIRQLGKRSLVSLKDQSGHEVGCILRSIITDLLHHCILNREPDIPLGQLMERLNDLLYASGVFGEADSFTAIILMIDHRSLEMTYLSAGHPRFLLLRGNDIEGLPGHGQPGRNIPMPLIPGMCFTTGTCRMMAGDKILLYSDGLTDAPRKKDHPSLGYEALRDLVRDLSRDDPEMPVSDLLRRLWDAVSDGGSLAEGAFPDDITLVGLEIEREHPWRERTVTPAGLSEIEGFILEVYEEIRRESGQRGFSLPDIAIRSVVTESAMNAWRHGNQCDPEKAIALRWRYGNAFHFVVQDEGEGFDHLAIGDPRSPHNLDRPSGRGIYIVRRYVDAVHWEDRGRRIVITIRKYRMASEDEERDARMRFWRDITMQTECG